MAKHALNSTVAVNEVLKIDGVWKKRVKFVGTIDKIIKHEGYYEYVVDGKKYRHHQLSKMTDKLRKILNLKETL
jgi:hypothetical protein